MHRLNTFMYLLFLCSFILGTVSAGYGQTTGKIAGSIIDAETGEPLVGVNVFLEGTLLGAGTDFEGDYYIINIPPGSYRLTASFVG